MYVERTGEGVVLHAVGWATYVQLDRARGESGRPRLAYLDGDLEIIMPGEDHEFWKTMLARFVETFAEESDVSLNGLGQTTYRSRAKEVGLEPDECYFIGEIGRVPELALEVSASRSGVNKLEIYRRLGVPEVWLWEKAQIQVFRLWGGEYRRRSQSVCLRELDLADLARRVVTTEMAKQTEAVRAYRKWLQRRDR